MKRMNTLVSILVMGMIASPFAFAQSGTQGSAGAGSEYPSQSTQDGTSPTQESDPRLQPQAQGNSEYNAQEPRRVGKERNKKGQQKPPTN